jgi:hypothetical protein
MGWKDSPYWLKGGMIGFVVSIVTTFWLNYKRLFEFPSWLLPVTLYMILSSIIFFGVGALIGLVYGKIKIESIYRKLLLIGVILISIGILFDWEGLPLIILGSLFLIIYSWKSGSPWLRVGSILALIYIILFSIVYIIETVEGGPMAGIFMAAFMSVPIGYLLSPPGEVISAASLFINIIFFFIMGGLFGRIYGKFKTKSFIQKLLIYILLFILCIGVIILSYLPRVYIGG